MLLANVHRSPPSCAAPRAAMGLAVSAGNRNPPSCSAVSSSGRGYLFLLIETQAWILRNQKTILRSQSATLLRGMAFLPSKLVMLWKKSMILWRFKL